MKKSITPHGMYVILFVSSQLLLGCREKEEAKPGPTPVAEVKLGKAVHSGGASREFSYHSDGQLLEIHGKGMYALGDNAESRSGVLYNAFGKIKEITTTGDSFSYKTLYSYNASRQLVRTEEYINARLQYYFTYEYNAQGQLIAKYSFAPQTPESSNFSAAIKREYEYDPRNNLSRVTEFSKAAASNDWTIYLSYQYLEYDNGHSVNHWLSYPHYLPDVKLQHNNPGKEIRTNHPSGATTVTTHAYAYNSKNYPVKRLTSSSNNTSSQITFSYTD
ncbi:MAG: hypothetical protein ICV83_14915 [Cytophagales bacterium]|nr:hypothetical protein [Cytophagales bacterium]